MRPLFCFTFALIVSSFAVAMELQFALILISFLGAVCLSLMVVPAPEFHRRTNVFAAAIGYLIVMIHPYSRVPHQEILPTEIIGQVCSPVRNGPTFVQYTVCTSDGKYVVRTDSRLQVKYLDTVRAKSVFSLPEPPRNIGEFDYKEWCRVHHVRALSSRTTDVTLLESSPNGIGKFITNVRDWINIRCKSALPSETASIASGILLSITDDLPFELQEAFGRTGTVHVLSTSGMHISVLVASVATTLVWTGRTTTAAVGLGLSIIVGYASGGGPAPLRAVSSLVTRLCARLLVRPPEPWHVLCICASLAVLRDPFVVMDAGAQLSFIAVAGLIIASPIGDVIGQRIRESTTLTRKILLTLAQGLLVSFIVSVETAPTVAYHMQHVSLISPIANLPVGLLSEWALIVGTIALLLGNVPLVSLVLWNLLSGILSALIYITKLIAELPYSDVSTGIVSPLDVIVTSTVVSGIFIYIGKTISRGAAASEPRYFVPWSPTKPIV